MEKYESLERKLTSQDCTKTTSAFVADNQNSKAISCAYQHTRLQSREVTEGSFDLWNEETIEDSSGGSRKRKNEILGLDATHSVFYLNAKRKFLKARRVKRF